MTKKKSLLKIDMKSDAAQKAMEAIRTAERTVKPTIHVSATYESPRREFDPDRGRFVTIDPNASYDDDDFEDDDEDF